MEKPQFYKSSDAEVREKKTKKTERPESWSTSIPFFFRVKTTERIFFFKYMAVMTGAGIPIETALQTIHKQTKSLVMHRVLHNMINDVNSGEFLSSTMERIPHIFDPLITSLVSVGETSGTLTEELRSIAEHLDKTRELRKKVLSALLYPAIVITGTIGVSIYMMFVLIPQLMPLFTSLNVELPFTTRAVIWISDFVIAHGVPLLIATIAAVIGISLLLRNRVIRKFVQHVGLRLPLFGPLLLKVEIAMLTRILGTLLGSGLTIVESVSIAADSIKNLVYKDSLKSIASSIQEGRDFSSHLKEHPNLFPPFVTQMIAVGEKTGKLDESFLYVADFAEREVDETTKSLTVILEPVFLIILGGIVGFLAISIITPVYKLTEGLQR